MVSTFTNPIVNSAIRLGTQAFDETDPVQLWPNDSLETVDVVIRAVYRQVLGNAHVMESERLTVAEAESQLRNHTITVREFVRQIAKSDLYRSRFFEPCSRNRFIELNFKHLLGRAPDSYGDIADHGNLLEFQGFEAEIDSYLDGDEYEQTFGENTVPYYRGHKSPTGQKVAGFANLLRLLRGASSNDNNVAHYQQARLNQATMANRIDAIASISGPTAHWQLPSNTERQTILKQIADAAKPPVTQSALQLGLQSFNETAPIELWPHDSTEAVDVVIRAVYRQVLGNAHVMESERGAVADAESQLRYRTITVREFIRCIAKSELYRTRFFEPCPRSRFIELNFKHLLGRAPNSYNDIADHSHNLDVAGFEAEIDSYIDSDEYNQVFGNNTVPYYRGHRSPIGQKVAGFANLLQLLRGNSSNDNHPSYKPQPRLTQAIMANHIGAINAISSPTDSKHPPLDLTLQLTENDKVAQGIYQGYESFRQTPAVELLPHASADDVEVVIRAVYRQVMGNAHIMESERLTVPESQLKQGILSVREFVRQVAKSELYRSRFTDNCYRYRAMELNFKHLLGRAPQNFEEMKAHSAILDTAGYDADIDSYIDSDEYQNAFGEYMVPYYRGYRTETGQTMLEFTNMLKLLKSASSSDKDPATNNAPRLMEAILPNQPIKVSKPRDVQDILAEVLFKSAAVPAAPVVPTPTVQPQINAQDTLITKLREQLAALRPTANIGAAVLRQGTPFTAVSHDRSQPQTDEKTALIERLQGELMEARALATIGEARLNKWQQRNFR